MLTMAATTAAVLLFATGPLKYMPNAALSAVVFVIGIKLVDYVGMRSIAMMRRDEFLIALATAVVVVGVGVEEGIILAIVLSILDHVRRHYTPHDRVITLDKGRPHAIPATPGARTEPGLIVYLFGVGLFYANAPRFAEEVLSLVDTDDPPRWFVLLATAIDDVDFTAGRTLLELADQLSDRNIVFAVADPNDTVLAELNRFGLVTKIGADHVYPSTEEALAAFRASKP